MPNILSPVSLQLSTARHLRPGRLCEVDSRVSPLLSTPDRRYASVIYSLPAAHVLLTPFFSALPYNFSVSPLSTADTHFNRGGRVSPLYEFRVSSFDFRGSHAFSVSCRLLCLSLSSADTSKRLFSAAYRLFLQIRGVGATFSTGLWPRVFPRRRQND